MHYHRIYGSAFLCFMTIALSGIFDGTLAQVSSTLINSTNAAIDTLRKRNCSVTIIGSNGSPLNGASISVKQVRHDFGFGAAISYDILSDTNLQKVFLDHFEWAVFSNEQKWPETDTSASGPDYTRPDELLAFCKANDIKVRGHNLFWNQDTGKIPPWTLTLNTADFMTAVNNRIDSAIGHYNGKMEHWDIANEVIHGNQLETRTGNSNIWSYIFNRVRNIDKTTKLTINDYNIIEKYSNVDQYIAKIKTLPNIDIIGLEGHFGSNLVQTDYRAKLDKVATLNKPMWITEADFSVPLNVRCDRFEELLRTAFAHPKMGGFTMWTFYQGDLWRKELTSFIADSVTYKINDLGLRYESLMKLWTTTVSGTTDANGAFAFRGFHGKYVATVKTATPGQELIDTVYLEPGQGVKAITIRPKLTGIASDRSTGFTPPAIRINGKQVVFRNTFAGNGPLFVSLYSISGKLLSRRQIGRNGDGTLPEVPAGFYILGIGTHLNNLSTAGISLP